MTRGTAGVGGLGWDFLNKMGRKRHASEYLADSGSVSSASTSKMPSGDEGEAAGERDEGGGRRNP